MSASRTIRRYRAWIAIGALAVIGIAVFLIVRQSKTATPTTSYQTSAVSKGTLSVTVSGTGNLAVDGTTDVYPSSSGEVASIKVKEGAYVKKGAVLFTLDASTAEANTARAYASYQQARQSVAQARAQLAKANNSLATLKDRSGSPTSQVTDADIDQAEAEVNVAAAGVTSAKASRSSAWLSYEDARDTEGDLVVRAPKAGVVRELNIDKGDTVSPSGGNSSGSAASGTSSGASGSSAGGSSSSGAPVVLAPKQPLAVLLTVNEVDRPALKVGQRADLTFDALPDLTATGKVYEISKTGTNTQGVVTFDVLVSLDVADPGLQEGMSAAATIVTQVAKDALLVPNSAVKSATDGSSYVLMLGADSSSTRQVAVEAGLSSATQTQILSGLKEGDKVITQTVSTTTSSQSTNNNRGGFIPGMGGGPRD